MLATLFRTRTHYMFIVEPQLNFFMKNVSIIHSLYKDKVFINIGGRKFGSLTSNSSNFSGFSILSPQLAHYRYQIYNTSQRLIAMTL